MSKSVIRTDQSKIIPYKNTAIELLPGAKIILGGGDIEVGTDLVRSSKAETRIRMRKNAVWSIYGGCSLSYGATIEILENAVFDCKYFTMNSNGVIVVRKKISMGQDVMLGRNVIVYDSDHHQIYDNNKKVTNCSAEVIIGNHVWLATNVTVLKGVTIGDESMVAANTVITKSVGSNKLVYSNSQICETNNYWRWKRKAI